MSKTETKPQQLELDLFPATPQIHVTQDDVKRLLPHLANWKKLNEILLLDTHTEDDLKKLILIEVSHGGREHMIERLLGKLHKKQSYRVMNAVHKEWGDE